MKNSFHFFKLKTYLKCGGGRGSSEHRPVLRSGRVGPGPKAVGSHEATELHLTRLLPPPQGNRAHVPPCSLSSSCCGGSKGDAQSSGRSLPLSGDRALPAGPGVDGADDMCAPHSSSPHHFARLGRPDPSHSIQASWTSGLSS